MASVPMTNLEAAKLLSLADRVQKYENNIYTLTEENIALKRSVAIMDAKYTELTGQVLIFETKLKHMAEKLSTTVPSLTSSVPEDVVHTTPRPSTPAPPPSAPPLPREEDFPPSAPLITDYEALPSAAIESDIKSDNSILQVEISGSNNSGNDSPVDNGVARVMSQEQQAEQGMPHASVANSTPTPDSISPDNIDNSIEQNTYISFALSNDGAQDIDVADTQANATFKLVKSKKITNSEKHKRAIACQNSAVETAIKAVRAGKSDVMIRDMAANAATDTAKSYSRILSENRSNNNASMTNSGHVPIAPIAGRKPTGPKMPTTLRGNSNRFNLQGKQCPNSNRKSHIKQYKKGIAVASDISIAAKRPDFLENKCLVISRVSKSTTLAELQAYVNARAGRQVKFMHQPQNLAKDYSKWRTIAIELSSTDYDLLSSPLFWDSGIRFQDYVGRRFWRNNASKMSENDRKNSLRQQWVQ